MEGVSSPKESQAAVSIRKENGMLKRQNNGSPLYIFSIVEYVLEVTLCTSSAVLGPGSSKIKVPVSVLKKSSNLARERFPDLGAGGWACVQHTMRAPEKHSAGVRQRRLQEERPVT